MNVIVQDGNDYFSAQDWGKAAERTMCSALGFDAILLSCQDSFGIARQDVMTFDAAFLADPA
ncbi:uncharacterized protein N7479_003937 [Penicillium vulpinum]|uniref:uncharacterized protein n=1 Tax=Penicillium vulpinum TaxID=29845 RepID=UPI0025479B87|nr:uncharacterized protein N7479_003937 [Penicillium vulpinum]KAJ5964061.1 hypothetical protein N7479_003937 [Penicillium vulpinum]